MKLDASFQVFVLDKFYFCYTKACSLQLNKLDKNNVSNLEQYLNIDQTINKILISWNKCYSKRKDQNKRRVPCPKIITVYNL